MELTHTASRPGKLSSFLKSELGLSTGLMNRLKYQNALLVNGNPERTNFPVSPGDRITVILDEPTPVYPPEPMALSIRYEDAHLLAVDKPSGMLIHPSRHKNTGTLANGVAAYYQETCQPCAFHPATRLDRDTFGIVLLAKNSHIHAALNKLHSESALRKTYHALVWNGPEENSGVMEAPIRRKPLPSLLREVAEDGQSAKTEFQVLHRGNGWSLLELRPLTGRTHQLRVHCAWAGFPILGDPQYGTKASLALSEKLGFKTQQLGAVRLTLPHPMTKQEITVASGLDVPLPSF